jgi:hypothetical protein
MAPDRRGRNVRKGTKLVVPYIPYDVLQTKGETCAKFGWDRLGNVDLYKVQINIETNKKNEQTSISSLHVYIRLRYRYVGHVTSYSGRDMSYIAENLADVFRGAVPSPWV